MKRVKVKTDPQIHTADIANLSHDGKGIARIQGKTTFIPGALTEETVEFYYTRVKKDFDEGRLVKVIKPSGLRVQPHCVHYQVCGGCSLQHMDETEQIYFKQAQLLDLLARYGHTEPQTMLKPLRSAHWNYRSKARLSVRYVEKKQAVMVGFRERNNPRYISDISLCPVLIAKVDKDIIYLRQLVDSLEDKHCIAQIEVAAGDSEIALIFRNLRPLNEEDIRRLQDFAEKYQYILFLQPGGVDSVYCLYPAENNNYLHYALPDYGLQLYFHPTDFTQVNLPLNRLMVKQAVELMELKNSDKVLDLFCGLGNFSLPMATCCSKVLGVEGSSTMVERAFMNATINQITNASFAAENLDSPEEVSKILQPGFNKMFIDPPRSGALEVVKQIDSLNPERIVYVSCNPVTLARDTDILVNQKGYVLLKAGVMDMFPHTTHVESMALFEKG